MIGERSELWARNEFVSDVHRHWHARGQTGCVFAQSIAVNASSEDWSSTIVREKPGVKAVEVMAAQIAGSIADPRCQMHSLLFPEAATPEALIEIIKEVLEIPDVFLERTFERGELTAIALRLTLGSKGATAAWLMGFGPFTFLPMTRRSPVTEIALRTKAKPKDLYRRLNPDREVAHLADYPLSIKDPHKDHLWDKTLQKTRRVLGKNPDEISAAKVTFAVPTSLWTLKDK